MSCTGRRNIFKYANLLYILTHFLHNKNMYAWLVHPQGTCTLAPHKNCENETVERTVTEFEV